MIIDPSVWGPPFWKTIHYVSLGFSPEKSPHMRDVYRTFYENLGAVIPCKICSHHYDMHLRSLPLTDEVMNSSESLFEWTVKMHNRVNRDHGKGQFTPDMAMSSLAKPNKDSNSNSRGTTNSCPTMSTHNVAPLIIFTFITGVALSALVTFIICGQKSKSRL